MESEHSDMHVIHMQCTFHKYSSIRRICQSMHACVPSSVIAYTSARLSEFMAGDCQLGPGLLEAQTLEMHGRDVFGLHA